MKQTILAIGIVILLVVMSIIPPSQALNVKNSSESFDMLIFLSPQYGNNLWINKAINRYIDAVKNDIDWNTKIIFISPENNDFRKIDQIIESYYENHTIKACIMVGEDINIAKNADWDYVESPSTTPWETVGGESRYYFDENNDCHSGSAGNYTFEICISLIRPTSKFNYYRKSWQIVKVFNKFSKNRKITFTSDILVFTDSENPNHYRSHREVCENLSKFGDLYYKEDPPNFEVIKSLLGTYSIYYVNGHSNPSLTDVTNDEYTKTKGNFYARYLDFLKTPFFMAGGCYVDGWWSNYQNNNRLDDSIRKPWYGAKIFTSQYIKAMVLGFPGQTAGSPGDPYNNFIINALPDLIIGKTLAESITGKIYHYDGDQTVYGDPTFHFTID